MIFKSYGKIEVKDGIRVNLSWDFVRYYQKLINFYYYNTLKNQLPAYGSHISVYLPSVHGDIRLSSVLHYDGKMVDFEYDPTDITITSKNIYMRVNCPIADKIKREAGIVDKNFRFYHITICNFKFN